MRFAHLADCHIGSWRDPTLREYGRQAFCKAIQMSLEIGVDFILISGDLFHTAQPPMDMLRETVLRLKECKDRGAPVYIISGSHDYSPSGKTMLDVLDAAGLVQNAARCDEADGKLRLAFTTDAKTGAKICGMVGRKGSLEKTYYENLDLGALESEEGVKIFMFHSAVLEHRPSGSWGEEAVPLSLFPKGFTYYAGGHVHTVDSRTEPGYGMFCMPGPTYPDNFEEMERLNQGGFWMYENGKTRHVPINIHPVKIILIDASGKTAGTVENMIREEAGSAIEPGTVVTLRVEGALDQGKVSDIKWNELAELFKSNRALLLRNTNKLISPELSPIKNSANTVDEIEDSVIGEHAGQLRVFSKEKERLLIRGLMKALAEEKGDGETVTTFEDRLNAACDEALSTPNNETNPNQKK